VTVLDANILLYAYNSDAAEHQAVSRWLAELVDSGESIGLPWVTLWAFIRIGTNPRIWQNPRSARESLNIAAEWLSQPGVAVVQPGVAVVQPGPRHRELLEKLVLEFGVAGPLVTDAVLAAIAPEHGAVPASTDQDFRRFAGVRWVNPLNVRQAFRSADGRKRLRRARVRFGEERQAEPPVVPSVTRSFDF
jgi:toxin-antitoxin system PIN domain toxin